MKTDSHDLLTKTQLASMLGCSKRTLSHYVESGVLPAPGRAGRATAWPAQELMRLPDLPPLKTRLQRRQRDAVYACVAQHADGEVATSDSKPRLPRGIPSGVCAVVNRPKSRPEILAEIHYLKRSVSTIGKEVRQEQPGSPLHAMLWDERQAMHTSRGHLEEELLRCFVPGHSADQLIAPYEFLCSPMFAVRSLKATRFEQVEVELRVNGVPTAVCSGPELRQDDAIVQSALVNLAQDHRPGATVMFSPEDLCIVLYGHYNGPNRKRLAASVERLCGTHVRYADFTVQLVSRFNQPPRGHWSVELDAELLRLYAQCRVVRLNLHERICLGNGLATWLYGYVSSQTALIPRSLDHLHRMCGSAAQPKAFRGSLVDALHQLAARGHIHAGWRIDRSVLRWRK